MRAVTAAAGLHPASISEVANVPAVLKQALATSASSSPVAIGRLVEARLRAERGDNDARCAVTVVAAIRPSYDDEVCSVPGVRAAFRAGFGARKSRARGPTTGGNTS
ncbi:hypothetical protein GCM10025862_34290 [Arsenicicoccus piscis]|uniref:Uncharacterized protein n=1 Tax=Arsenicicoccus piscis TaxID=673954 RepID=A0ABQ6HU74_9MICO|nr:hypothetical protein GCM10025862_34290 [Arsenicicoccus piscis]